MPRLEFSQRSRTALLSQLEGEEFDLLVIGGGITGAGIARDASLRGLRVALVERKDFACGTSSRSSKLIHGGVRYLEQGDVGLVMEAASERRAVRRIAPYLVRPVQMVVPVSSRRSYAKLSVGLWTYDRMARVREEERYRMLSREEVLEAEPALGAEKVYGAGVYYEYLTDDARLVLATIKRAAELGATVINYATVTHLIEGEGRLEGAQVEDAIGGSSITVRARVIVNAAGPWVDSLRVLSGSEKSRLHLTKGIHVVVPRQRLPISHIVVMLARDRRAVFAVPRDEVVYIGTTDTNYEGPYDNPVITAEDVQYLLEAVERTFDVPSIGFEDVCGAWAGLRPLLHEEGKKPTELSRKDEIMIGPSGLISIAGGKLTTFRRMAERVMEIVAERLKEQGATLPETRGKSDSDLLCGGDTGGDVAAFADGLASKWTQISREIVDRLVWLYGSDAARMVEGIAADPELGRRLAPGSLLTRVEVEYNVREEMAATLEDVLERRTRLLLFTPDNGVPAARETAVIMGRQLGWDSARIESEVSRYAAYVQSLKSFAAEQLPGARAAHG